MITKMGEKQKKERKKKIYKGLSRLLYLIILIILLDTIGIMKGIILYILFIIFICLYRLFFVMGWKKFKEDFMFGIRFLEGTLYGKPLDKENWAKGEKPKRRKIKWTLKSSEKNMKNT